MGRKAMSTITLNEAKSFLDVIHSADDDKIQLLLDAAEDEARAFLNREDLEEWNSNISSTDPVPGSVKIGVLLLLQSNYQATPDEAEQLRKVAEMKLQPYRIELGI
jgi:hypothetical protein